MTESLSKNLFSPKFRLKTKKDFEVFFLSSKSKTLGSVKIFYAKCKVVETSRIGISVSSRYFNSVKRNSLKRLVREFFRNSKNQFFMMDVVVTVRYNSELSLDWSSFLAKVKVDLMNVLISIKNK